MQLSLEGRKEIRSGRGSALKRINGILVGEAEGEKELVNSEEQGGAGIKDRVADHSDGHLNVGGGSEGQSRAKREKKGEVAGT